MMRKHPSHSDAPPHPPRVFAVREQRGGEEEGVCSPCAAWGRAARRTCATGRAEGRRSKER